MATPNLARPVQERIQDAISDLKLLLSDRVTTAEVSDGMWGWLFNETDAEDFEYVA